MLAKLTTLSCIGLLAQVLATDEDTPRAWNYLNETVWPAENCSEGLQSPINIQDPKKDPALKPLEFKGFKEETKYKVTLMTKEYTWEVKFDGIVLTTAGEEPDTNTPEKGTDEETPSATGPAPPPPATEAPTEAPATEAPTTEAPTEAPTTEAPTEAPTEPPTTEAPTEPPTTEAPTDAPTTTEATSRRLRRLENVAVDDEDKAEAGTPDAPEENGMGVIFEGVFYALQGWKFKSPSEHTLDGKYFDMEAQFIHEAEGDEMLNIAVLMEQPKVATVEEPTSVQSMAQYFTEYENVTKEMNDIKDVYVNSPYDWFFPEVKSYVTYTGSDTAPPCDLGVKWVVMTSPVTVTPSQLALYRESINTIYNSASEKTLATLEAAPEGVTEGFALNLGTNNRDLVETGERSVLMYTDPTDTVAEEMTEIRDEDNKMWVTLGSVAAAVGGLGLLGLGYAYMSGKMQSPNQVYEEQAELFDDEEYS
eukprot:gnl/TRDRNA2_/TRDRNA2_163783_c0_seq1.p1 gnl/TRDRNA2_/TRDRNA2_163783_c0~~gnl/TRDRNA2_/TRDRNA2_163783_c0_seq1.p1  ORF type:complete len:495 (+),score=102.18 gnl/TRDRNA2_/TRDRNA2_163783_c0_seq1:57-1487(+)